MASKGKFEQAEKAVDEFCSFCEKVVVRALMFGCFIYEAVKFVAGILR